MVPTSHFAVIVSFRNCSVSKNCHHKDIIEYVCLCVCACVLAVVNQCGTDWVTDLFRASLWREPPCDDHKPEWIGLLQMVCLCLWWCESAQERNTHTHSRPLTKVNWPSAHRHAHMFGEILLPNNNHLKNRFIGNVVTQKSTFITLTYSKFPQTLMKRLHKCKH